MHKICRAQKTKRGVNGKRGVNFHGIQLKKHMKSSQRNYMSENTALKIGSIVKTTDKLVQLYNQHVLVAL